MKVILRVILLLTLSFSVLSVAADYMNYEVGIIGGNAIQPPPDTFLLIRKQDKVCAVKFTEWQRGNDKSTPTTFQSGEESYYAKYVWYLGEKKGGDWVLNPPVRHGESNVTKKRSYGIGRFAFGGGDFKINCGAFNLKWTPPANVYFYEYYNKERQYDTEIALTRWRTFEEIRLDDSLEWLRYDENRPISIIN